MIKRSVIKIHPLFLVFVGAMFYFKEIGFFLNIFFCCLIQEMGYAFICMKKGFKVRHLLFTPLGVRAELKGTGDIAFEERASIHMVGSGLGILMSIVLFAFEKRGMALFCLILAVMRLVPVLPLEGGRIWLGILGKWKGTLRAAGWLTKIGCGIGYGLCVVGVIFMIVFPRAFFLVPTGLYLIYANKREFLHIAKKLYYGMLEEREKPCRGVVVSGKEEPLELAMHLNPYEETFFFRRAQGGVSQDRVMLALLSGRDTKWIWKVADEKDFDAKTYKVGYDGM